MRPICGKRPANDRQGPDLRHRILATVLLVSLFHILSRISVFNVDEDRLRDLLADNPLAGIVNLFAGGEVLTHFSLVGAGTFPYFLALALVKGTIWIVPPWREYRKSGPREKKRLETVARWSAIPLALLLAGLISRFLAPQIGLFPGHIHWYTGSTFHRSLAIVSMVTVGTALTALITDAITRRGIGSGEGIVLVVGASLEFSKKVGELVRDAPHLGVAIQRLVAVAIVGLVAVVLSFYLNEATRYVSIFDGKRRALGRLAVARSPSRPRLPLLLNVGRTIPVAGALGWLTLCQSLRTFFQANVGGKGNAVGRVLTAWATPDDGVYWVVLTGFVVAFVYSCNYSLLWRPFEDSTSSLAERLKKESLVVYDVRPGDRTEIHLSQIMARITVVGAAGVALLAVGLPYAILKLAHYNALVFVLSVMVVVRTIGELRSRVVAHRTTEATRAFGRPR